MIRLRVKEIAEEKKISMTRLARIADVDYKTVRKIFRNPNAEIGLITLDKLAWALQVEPADLIEYKRTPPAYWQELQGADEDP
ncbi:XRE family transcriptional regulator [Ktedonosporobacter rubrisoli]|uniref:XRE family transcriptional regulator n=1 Tax=Ktedonosporobacter rubrisoli TaxID=2509675 RepID=A0A4P6JTD1_KTERU|nr:helix-turn-helix transcriptional regulator [Ktedonosporobacter rubrisoli]QBD78563.1 XRE family transcriptional regulator [Ktedonosporobacter rubrisoli]